MRDRVTLTAGLTGAGTSVNYMLGPSPCKGRIVDFRIGNVTTALTDGTLSCVLMKGAVVVSNAALLMAAASPDDDLSAKGVLKTGTEPDVNEGDLIYIAATAAGSGAKPTDIGFEVEIATVG